MNAFRRLREGRLLTASKPFLARGITVTRCPECWLGQNYCICVPLSGLRATSTLDIVLLLHRDEILKPTNTGRLVAEVMPNNCEAFIWHRKEPALPLLQLLADQARQCYLFFPAQDSHIQLDTVALQNNRDVNPEKRVTIIVPDGTWREASRMASLSAYLRDVPRVQLNSIQEGQYSVRAASDKSRLATAEAVAQLLQECGEVSAGDNLSRAFRLFNRHYRAMRDCVPVNVQEQISFHG